MPRRSAPLAIALVIASFALVGCTGSPQLPVASASPTTRTTQPSPSATAPSFGAPSTGAYEGTGYAFEGGDAWEEEAAGDHDLKLSFTGSAATGHLSVDVGDAEMTEQDAASYRDVLAQDPANQGIGELRTLQGFQGATEAWYYYYEWHHPNGDVYPSYALLANFGGRSYLITEWAYDGDTLDELNDAAWDAWTWG